MPHAAAPGLIPVGVKIVHIARRPGVVTALCGRRCGRSRDEYTVDFRLACTQDQWLREDWSVCIACARQVTALDER